MKFLNPQGFWLLLAIPVLIIIYLIKNQHEDKAVSSTYIWKLSSKFVKKRLPIQRLRKILLFMLQLLMITGCALIAAKPATVSGERYDYVAVIDCSASMMQKDDGGVSRFDHAVDAVSKLGEEMKSGHTVSVILANDSPFYLIRNAKSESEVKTALGKAFCSYGGCNVEEAMSLAQSVCDGAENPKVVFYTDKEYEKVGNVTVVPLNSRLWNVAVEGFEVMNEDGKTWFVSNVTGINKDAEVAVGLKIDGKLKDAKMVECLDGKTVRVAFSVEGDVEFEVAEIFVEAEDGLEADNSYVFCRKSNRKVNILLMSQAPFYLQTVFGAMEDCNVEIGTSVDEEVSGWDLYIYDGVYPKEYPTDGSVMVFGTDFLPEGLSAGVKYQNTGVVEAYKRSNLDICKDITFRGVVIGRYTELIGSNKWNTLLTCDGSAVLSARKNSNGTAFSVFSFDLHHSNLPLKADFLVLMKALAEYSLPTMLDRTDYTVGESVSINILPFTRNLYMEYPDETAKELLVDGTGCSVIVDSVGIYSVAARTDKGGEYLNFFVHVPDGETISQTGGAIGVSINNDQTKSEDVHSPVWFFVAIAALLILFIEWGLYYREQY